uniref:SFRICE_008179 n=1 Tax=Spodoptera frugiperda TaxID=7108 RepID=A0A2H1V9I8_SPOFR
MADVELFLQEYLNKVLGEHKYVNPEITIEATSSGGANYTSKLYTAVVREAGKEDLHLFAKVAIAGENMRKDFAEIYETENYAYTKLVKFYETVERECGVPEEDRLVFCKFYGFDPSLYREILVLENLLPQGYGPHDRFHSIDWPYAAAAIRELAKMHALSFAFAKRYPEEFEKTLSTFKGIWETLPFEILEPQRIECAVNVINPKYLDKFMNYMKGGQFPAVNLWKPSRFKAIIHGDYRGNNLLHRVRKAALLEPTMAEVELSLREYINIIAREHKYVNPDITIEGISSEGGNYSSKLYTAVVREAGKEDLHLFAKVAVTGEDLRKHMPDLYTTENYAYTKLIQLYETLEREGGVLEEDRLVFCKFYGFDPSLYREILVLENLLPQGYGPHDRFHSIDWPYAAAAVRELAKMHALSFAFAKRHPEEFEKTFSTLKGIWEALPFEEVEPKNIECAIQVLGSEHRDKFINHVKRREYSVRNFWKPSAFKVIMHGDYRGSNMMKRVRKANY